MGGVVPLREKLPSENSRRGINGALARKNHFQFHTCIPINVWYVRDVEAHPPSLTTEQIAG
jgi:hypothetical protein